MAEKETYQVAAFCENCGHTPKEKTINGTVVGPLMYRIPKGISARMFFRDVDCLNCGCGVLRKFP